MDMLEDAIVLYIEGRFYSTNNYIFISISKCFIAIKVPV
jgi:hypothetical protein